MPCFFLLHTVLQQGIGTGVGYSLDKVKARNILKWGFQFAFPSLSHGLFKLGKTENQQHDMVRES